MREFAAEAARLGWTLRSGGAAGADEAFEDAVAAAGGAIESFHPWPGFRANERVRAIRPTLSRPTDAALLLSSQMHSSWSRLSRGARALHGRNAHQVLGAELHTPSDVVVCWPPDGSLDGSSRQSGGTGQPLRIAARHGVPGAQPRTLRAPTAGRFRAGLRRLDRVGAIRGREYGRPCARCQPLSNRRAHVNPAELRQQTPHDAPSALGLALHQSPLAVRRAVQSLATYARRELDYAAVGYHADAPNPRAEAWLWSTEDWDDKARAVGFCVMLGDDPGTWMMTWVWFHPFERRRRHLSEAWPFLRERYGDFAADRPSEAMQTFLASL